MTPAEKISRMLERRPAKHKFRDQLFWLVDIVFACKASGDATLQQHAALVEDALGQLGAYLETGDRDAMQEATRRVEAFAAAIQLAVSQDQKTQE